MSEEEIINILQNVICDEVIGTYCLEIQKTTNIENTHKIQKNVKTKSSFLEINKNISNQQNKISKLNKLKICSNLISLFSLKIS